MPARNVILSLLAVSTLLFLAGCGSSSPKATAPPSGGFSNSSLNGTYVFSTTGSDSSSTPATIAIAGTLVADGSGGITGGTIDVVDPNIAQTSPVAQSIGSGTYTVTADGRGQISLGSVKLDFVLSSTSHGLVTEFDGNGSGSGTIDLQASTTQAQLAGSYAFSLGGLDSSLNPTATVGSFTLDGSGNLTAGVQDFNDDGFPYLALPILASTATAPSGTGPGSITLSTTTLGTYTFDYYPVDTTHLKLIETDYNQFLAGDAFTQTGASIPTGAMVFTLSGLDSSGPIAAGGLFTSDGTGNFTGGLEDVNNDGSLSPAQLAFTGASAAGGTVGGRVIVNLSGFTPAIQYAIYPITGGILMIETDSLAITTGSAYAQTSTALQASQGYGLNLSADNISGGYEEDDIAEFQTTSSTFSGLLDINDEGTTTFDKTLTGSYTPDSPATGRGSATTTNYFNFEYYTVSDSTALILESDSTQIGVGTLALQTAPNSSSGVAHPVPLVHPAVRAHAALHSSKRK